MGKSSEKIAVLEDSAKVSTCKHLNGMLFTM